ncbi:N-formylglutamate amidohydrolase [Roseobacter sp. HKCCA0434]|uniref:N-formylglutamate amidohydrolase n=1 Tax=Roseobacter sp. HKCCA0434 TaxID=3079297 RepID=UPI002905927B|nr:N-formylglutamate amidohydrolase [Roseobacter sp. HKCCA0434]
MEPYELTGSEGRPGATVFSSPHSGAHYPDDFLRSSQLDPLTLRSSEDAFVHRLFASAPRHGAPLLSANYARAYVDLNRAASELDPALIDVPRRPGLNPRVAAGLGVIPRVVAEGRAIRSGRIPLATAQDRLDRVYHPYHIALGHLLEAARLREGAALLIDCHSMPRGALRHRDRNAAPRPQIVLGDRFGTACAPWITDLAQDAFTRAGFVVARNMPFAGGYITETYGRPSQGFHALQIEIDRSLYMDERRIRPLPGFDALRARLAPVIATLATALDVRRQLAAE